jgi:ATP-dependent Clp protease protease subunit
MGSLLWLDSQSDDPIRLYINTPGGHADCGFAIFDLIRFIKAPVYNITFGLNASAGTILLLGE